MIKMKLIELRNAENSLGKLLQSSLDVKTSYWLGKIVKKIVADLKDAEDIRNKLIKKHGVQDVDKDGKVKDTWSVPADKQAAYLAEYTDAMGIEVTYDIGKLKLSQLIASGVKMTPIEMNALDPIIEDDTPPEPPKK